MFFGVKSSLYHIDIIHCQMNLCLWVSYICYSLHHLCIVQISALILIGTTRELRLILPSCTTSIVKLKSAHYFAKFSLISPKFLQFLCLLFEFSRLEIFLKMYLGVKGQFGWSCYTAMYIFGQLDLQCTYLYSTASVIF